MRSVLEIDYIHRKWRGICSYAHHWTRSIFRCICIYICICICIFIFRLHTEEMAGYLLLCTSLDQKYILFVFVLIHVFVFFLCICIYICFRLQPQEMAGGLLLLCTSLDQMYISFVFYFLMYLYLFKCICIRSHPEKMLVSAPMHITEPEALLDGLAWQNCTTPPVWMEFG